MPGANYRALLDTIDKLYGAALEPARWERFLDTVVELFEADHAFVCQAENRRRPFDYVGLSRFNRTAVPLARYEMDRDPRRRAFNLSNGRAVHCRMASSDDELHRSQVYREYLRPLDIEYTMIIALPTQPGFTHDLGLTRSRSRRAFDSNDCDLLNELAPHL